MYPVMRIELILLRPRPAYKHNSKLVLRLNLTHDLKNSFPNLNPYPDFSLERIPLFLNKSPIGDFRHSNQTR